MKTIIRIDTRTLRVNYAKCYVEMLRKQHVLVTYKKYIKTYNFLFIQSSFSLWKGLGCLLLQGAFAHTGFADMLGQLLTCSRL